MEDEISLRETKREKQREFKKKRKRKKLKKKSRMLGECKNNAFSYFDLAD